MPDSLAGPRSRVAGRATRPGRRLRGVPVVAAGAMTALLVTGAGWPGGQPAATRAGARAPTLAHAVAPFVPVPGGSAAHPRVAPLHRLRHADLLVVSTSTLPAGTVAAIRGLAGVRAAVPVDAARVRVNGNFVAVLGVDASRFRAFADKPTASDTALWRSVADGNMAISYAMSRLGKFPAGSFVTVAGQQKESLVVGGTGTVGIAGVDAVVSDQVARSLGFPAGNAVVISVDGKRLRTARTLRALTSDIGSALPRSATVEPLVVPGAGARAGSTAAATATSGSQLSAAQITAMLRAALSRVGMPYVWGAAGPASFDCSGLVQWSFARAGVVMPRVAADQARTGPAVPVSRLEPGDLLFYHTDPTAPSYISHVAIYLGNGRMIQAPQPGQNVEVVPVDLGSEFAGAVAVSPSVAAAVAGSPVG